MKPFVIVVDFQLKPGTLEQFIPLMLENAAASARNEPGCQRFDVLTPKQGGERIFLYEIYDDEAAFDAHLQTPHFLKFRDAVKPFVERQTVERYRLEQSS